MDLSVFGLAFPFAENAEHFSRLNGVRSRKRRRV